MAPDADIPYGTLDVMVLKTLDAMGPRTVEIITRMLKHEPQ